jgi:hypothetical protein
VIVCDAYRHRRAWAAWHSGLVANGSVRKFDQLLPAARDTELDDARQEDAFLNLWARAGGASDKDDGDGR